MDDATKAVLEHMSKRNAGALDVCLKLMDNLGELAAFDFALLDEQGILGSDLWDLWKVCERDIPTLHATIAQGTGAEKLRQVPGSTFWLQTHSQP